MLGLILSSVGFISWALAIIVIYYSDSYSPIDHSESATGYGSYLFMLLIVYGCYKCTTLFLGWKKISFGFFSILGITLFHILMLSVIYTGFPEVRQSPFMEGKVVYSMTLFLNIIKLLIYPIILVFLTRSIGYVLAGVIVKSWKDIDIRLRIPAEITLGFMLFTAGLILIGSIGYFTLTGLISLLVIMAALGYRGHRETYFDIRDRAIVLDNHDFGGDTLAALNPRLLSIEFGFIILTFLLGVSLINVIRPMPIGWDDLGVYMNFPKIMAMSGSLLEGSGMYAWQLITGTGFLFSYIAAQAFYVNQLGGILAVIAIVSTLSYAFEKKGKVALISLPILFGAIYYAMPMTVFQQAKDMKLDPAYLFFSISGLMLLFHAWKHKITDTKFDLRLLALIGIIIGFTFSVKFTSVMLIIACLGVISYRILSFSGYLGFFFIFLAIFTKLDFWKMMSVQIPRDNPGLVQSIVIIFLVLGLALIGFSIFRKHAHASAKKLFGEWFFSCLVLLGFFVVGCSPWIIKNINEVGFNHVGQLNLNSMLNGSGGVSDYNYQELYTPEELETKKKAEAEAMTKEGTSQNEDMGRYFGYETGLNNYLKLPANLTFQKNQAGEFTDITYIFFALLPGLILFVHGRRPYTILAWGSIAILFMVLYYFKKDTSLLLTQFFNQFTISIEANNWKSYGYGILLLLNIGLLTIMQYGTKNTETNIRLREVMMFMGIYAFLFAIAAFGIVWYGIMIYFGFFLIMGYSALRFVSEDTHEGDTRESGEKTMIHLFLSLILFGFIAFYLASTGFPRGWNNLKSAYYNEYKYGIFSQEESIFAYRGDYLVPIATMNLRDVTKVYDGIAEKMQSTQMKQFLSNPDLKNLPIDSVHEFLLRSRNTRDPLIRKDIETLGTDIYNQVLYPPKENTNTGGIYRIGTFMTYLINDNRKRYFEDSLISTFNDYFYDPSAEKTIERMRSIGLKYLLVDLNAATIDRDPRRALTERSEKLLLTMNASNLRLVSTDNLCLELAIAERKKGRLVTDIEFLDIAATNSESYRNGMMIHRSQKQANCYRYIITMINEKRSGEYPTIKMIEDDLLQSNAAQDPQKIQAILKKYASQSWFALFEITDTPPLVTPVITAETSTGIVQ